MKISESIENYIRKQEYKKSTVMRYADDKKRIVQHLGDFDTEEINTEFLQNCIRKLENHGYSYNVVTSTITLIKMTSGVKISGKLRYKHDNKEEKTERFYTKEEISKIQNYIISKGKITYIPIIIAINTGMRIGEIMALKWGDIDFDKGTIKVNKSAYLGEITKPKTYNGNREIPLTEKLARYLYKFKSEKDLFVHNNKEKITNERSVQRTNENILKKLGIEPKGMHAYRHSFATQLLNNSDNYKAITEIMGHSNIETTQNIYQHCTLEDKKDIVCNNKKHTSVQYDKHISSESDKKLKNLENKISKLTEDIEKITKVVKVLYRNFKKMTDL